MKKQINVIIDFLDKNGAEWTGNFRTQIDIADRTYGVYVGCEVTGVSMEIVFPMKIRSADMGDAERVIREVNDMMEFGTIDLRSCDEMPVLKLYAVRQLPDKNEVTVETLEMLLGYAKRIIENNAQKIYDAVTFTEEDQKLTLRERIVMNVFGQEPEDIAREKRRARLSEQKSQ